MIFHSDIRMEVTNLFNVDQKGKDSSFKELEG